jgi:hypothetical protein
MGKLYFQNQDNEWEEFPDEEAMAHIRASAQILQDMEMRCSKFCWQGMT